MTKSINSKLEEEKVTAEEEGKTTPAMEKMEQEQTQIIVGHVVLISNIPVWLVDISRIQRITINKQQQQTGGTDPSATYISENEGWRHDKMAEIVKIICKN